MFGAQVRAHRQRLGLSQEELAARTGVSVRSIGNLEASRTGRPRPATVRMLADAFGLAGADRDRFCQSVLEDQSVPEDTDQQPAEETSDSADTVAARGRPVPAQLPADLAGFVGRGDQLSRLTNLLDRGDRPATVVISAIAGTAGVGKTCLAVHWAHQVLAQFPDGQLYANLRGFDPGGAAATPGEVVRSFLDALGVPAQRVPAGLDAQTALYRSLLAQRRMLVLLDNARDAEQVRPLLPGTPSCLLLVTSRNELTGLTVGAGAVPVPLDLLNPNEARDLLAQRLGVDRVAAEPAAVDEIIKRCARLPLALAVVAARAAAQPGRPLATLAADLRPEHGRLDSLATGDGRTDARSVFSWSYQQLSAPAARLFGLLGVHPGPDLSVSAAASLTGVPPRQVRPLLAELIRAHLVTEPVPGRYTLHDLLRVYAGELATGEPDAERQAAVCRLLDHYLHSTHRAAAVLDPTRTAIELVAPRAGVTVDDIGSAGGATGWFTAEYQVLMAAVQLAVDAGLDRNAWQLVWSMTPFLDHRDIRDAGAIHHIALQAAQRLDDPAAQGFSHGRLGMVHARLGEHDEAQTNLEHALEVYRQLGDDTNQARAQLVLAGMLDRQGRYQDALNQAEQALALFKTSDDRTGQASALSNLGWCHTQLGAHETALEHCQQALRLMHELGDRRGQAHTWDSIGVAYHHLGRHADAAAAYQQALTLQRDLGYRYYEANILEHLGDTYHASGDTHAALDHWQEALTILTELHHPDAKQVRARLHNVA